MSASVCARLLAGAAPCLLVLLLTGKPALAATATPAQAAAMENQVRDALDNLLGPPIKLGDRPMQITPAGDHYNIAVPIQSKDQEIRLTGTARAGENGIWIVDGITVTSPVHFIVDVAPPRNGGPPGPASPVAVTIEQQGQDGRIVWDPSFATPSTWTTTTQATSIHADVTDAPVDTLVGPTNAITTLRPAGSDRVDVLLDGTLQNYRVVRPAGDNIAVERSRVSGALNGVSRARGVTLIQALSSIIATGVRAPAIPGQAPTIAPELVRVMLGAMQDLASDFTLDEALDGFILKAQAQVVTADHMRLGLNARSDAGVLRAGLDLGVDGLDFPEIQLGELKALLPKRFAVRPVIGGVAVIDLLHLATVSSEGRNPGPDDMAALFSHGGITGGLESLTIDLGGTTFTGQAQMVATSPAPDAITGTAQVTADNFDALTQRVSALPPPIAQQVLPVLVFIKGIGRTLDGRLVWDLSYKNQHLLVNNMDLTAMTAGASPGSR